jgi:hypothetical protein
MATDNTIEIRIKTAPVGDLDTFALRACQDDNFGNANDWFGTFRGGLFGFDARIFGIKTHFRLVHSWVPEVRHPTETEYHIASLFFGMDSAIECFVFMLNALGHAAMPSGFWDVADSSTLTKVAPKDILGPRDSQKPVRSGYSALFPNLQAHWISNRELVFTLMDLHDVSKHRQTIYTGGQLRLDPPPQGFFESFGVQNDTIKQMLLTPHSKILVKSDPKGQKANPTPTTYYDRPVVETLVENFRSFIEQSCILARDEARANIKLPGGQPEFSPTFSTGGVTDQKSE